MAWTYLLIAGLLEIGWAVGLKYTHGFTRLGPSVWTVVTMIGSFWMLAQAARTLPLGTAYAVWTGIGVLGTAVLGMILFHEPRTALRLGCIALILAGIAGLKLTTSS
jgi:quaternary ammonium compound-resistance protein SugE